MADILFKDSLYPDSMHFTFIIELTSLFQVIYGSVGIEETFLERIEIDAFLRRRMCTRCETGETGLNHRRIELNACESVLSAAGSSDKYARVLNPFAGTAGTAVHLNKFIHI